MSQNLNAVIPTLYESLDVVSRELTGFIPSVARDSGVERAAKGQSVNYHVVPEMSAADIEASNTLGPNPGDTVLGSDTMTISKSRSVTFHWTGEEQRGAGHSGQMPNVLRDQFSQAMRTLVNEVEGDLAGEYKLASYGYGTAGTTPFGSNLEAVAQMRKILDDNGTPPGDRSLVINTAAGANLRSLTQLSSVNQAGTDATLRQGVLLDLSGFAIRESAQIGKHETGTATDVETRGTDNDKGSKVLKVTDDSEGAMDLNAGDVIEIADIDGKYVVAKDVTEESGEWEAEIELVSPLLEDVPAGRAVTVVADYVPNVALHRSALQLVTRAPAMPEGGDAAADVTEIQDPRTGLGFQIALYRQRRQITYEVGLAWGWKTTKSMHKALLLG